MSEVQSKFELSHVFLYFVGIEKISIKTSYKYGLVLQRFLNRLLKHTTIERHSWSVFIQDVQDKDTLLDGDLQNLTVKLR